MFRRTTIYPSKLILSELLRQTGIALNIVSLAAVASASPTVPAGDLSLRHDIRLLADYGVINGPASSWPLAWGPIISDLSAYQQAEELPGNVLDAMARVIRRANWETAANEFHFDAKVGLAAEPTRLRSYQDTPREDAELSLGISWIGDMVSLDLNAQYVASPADGEEFRADNSMIGVIIGNYAVTLNTLDRWWGPGWDGSLVMSNNARPIPAISIERNFTNAFDTRWLSWLGPWDVSVLFGRFEEDRAVPNAHFFGFRFDFRPIPSLEIGLSRAAQWCGDDRPCDFDTFVDMLLGRDNRDEGSSAGTSDEPGNQLAGFDLRWSLAGLGLPIAVYGQGIGEDEAGGFPSRYLGQIGIDGTAMLGDKWSMRWYAEGAYTKCNFYSDEDLFNCAYNHSIYRTGYRYHGRSVGHAADNDALIFSAGVVLVDRDETQWHSLLRFGELNRGGEPDERNSLTPTKQSLVSIDLMHSRAFPVGVIEVGAGYEYIEDEVLGDTSGQGRAFVQWRSSY